MYEQFLGQLMVFAGNFAPKGWATCDGQLMSIAQNSALFSILGTTYGGDGINTFALPNLKGRVATSYGQGPGLSGVTIGQQYGTETNTMTNAQLPAHNHVALAASPNVMIPVNSGDEQDSDTPVDCFLKQTPGVDTYAGSPSSGGEMGPTNATITVGNTGSSQPINNLQPTLTLTYCIALQGIYPSRN